MSLLMEALRKAERRKRAGASEGNVSPREEPLSDGGAGFEAREEAGTPVGPDGDSFEVNQSDDARGRRSTEEEPAAVTLEPLDEDSLLALDLPDEAPGEDSGEVPEDPPKGATAEAVAPPVGAGTGKAETLSRQAQETPPGSTPERTGAAAGSPPGGEGEKAPTGADKEARKKPEVETWRAKNLGLAPGGPGLTTPGRSGRSSLAKNPSPDSREDNPTGNPEMARLLMEAKKRNHRFTRLGSGVLLLAFLLVAVAGGWYYSRLQPQLEGLLYAGLPDAPAGERSARVGPEDGGNVEQNRDPALATGAAAPGSATGNGKDVGVSGSVDEKESPVLSGKRSDASPAGEGEAPFPAADRKPLVERAVPASDRMPPTVAPPAAAQAQPQVGEVADVPRNAREAYDQAVAKQANEDRSSARIEIRRGTKKRSTRSVLHRAWEAFQQGDYARARRFYHSVAEENPLDRDALLGLAALAVTSGENSKAQEYYLRLLERDPRDAAALAGMISLRGMNEVPEAISRIQNLIATHPDLGELHFILGNLYAAQSRWAYAQQAYFRAYALEPARPDYAFNLAVSLDHLGKREQALDYYRRALEAGRGQRKGFSEAAVRSRIALLEGT